MNNHAVKNIETMEQLWKYIPEELKTKYLFIPLTGITISHIIVSVIKAIKDYDCEAQLKLGVFEATLRPAKMQVIQ